MKPNMTHKEIKQLGPHDVLLGRGTGPNESIGNIRFRESIQVIIEHSGIRRLDGPTKADLTTLIVARIKEVGGKFVKKVNLGKANETAKGCSLESVYEEVCDAVACAKVKQCIRHQLSRSMCSRSAKMLSLTRPATPPCKKTQAWLSSFEAISTTPRSPFQQPARSPALSSAAFRSKMLLSPSDAAYQRRKGQCEEPVLASLVDSQQQRQSSLAITSADSQPHACMTKEHFNTILLHCLGLPYHGASTSRSSIVPAMPRPPYLAPTFSEDQILKKLFENQQQELALLREVFLVRGNKKKLLEEQTFPHLTHQLFHVSPLGMLEALLLQERDIHRSEIPSANGSMLHHPSMATPKFF